MLLPSVLRHENVNNGWTLRSVLWENKGKKCLVCLQKYHVPHVINYTELFLRRKKKGERTQLVLSNLIFWNENYPMTHHVRRLFGRSVGWLVSWLVGWSVGWLVCRSIGPYVFSKRSGSNTCMFLSEHLFGSNLQL